MSGSQRTRWGRGHRRGPAMTPNAKPGASASPDTEARPPDSSLRNTGFAFAALVISAAFTAILTLFLVRALDPTRYGLFGLAGGIAGLLLLPSDLGVSQSAARFIADRRDDRLAVAEIVATALRIKLVVTGAVTVVLFVSAGAISAAYDEPGLTWVLRGFALAMFAESFMLLLTYAFVAEGRASRNISITLIESFAETSLSIGFVVSGGGAIGAAFGRAIAYGAGFVWAFVLTVRELGWAALKRAHTRISLARQIVRYGGAVLVVDSAYTIFTAIDVLIIGWVLTASSVGLFVAPTRLIALLQLPSTAISSGVSPRMAVGFAAHRDGQTFARGLSYVVVFQMALIPPLLVWPEPIVHLLLGSNYDQSVDTLRALTPFAVLLGFGGMFSVTANYLGLARRRIPISVATVLVNLALDVALIPRFGIIGGAIGTDVAYAVYAPAHYWICRNSLDIQVRVIATTIARSCGAAVAMAGVLVSFGTRGLTVSEIVIGGSLATAVYFAVLAATARLSGGDRETLLGI